MTEKQKNLIVRTITGVLFIAVMLAGFLEGTAMVLLFALITMLALWEYTGLVNQQEDITVNRFITTVAGVYFFFAVAGYRTGITGSNFVAFVPYILTLVYLFISELYTGNKNAIHDWAYTMLGQMYIALPLSLINILAFETQIDGVHYSAVLPLSIFVFLWTNDTGAYCSGSLFGKHKLFPRISPGKSWEGSIGGGIFVLIVAALIGYFTNNASNGAPAMSILEWMGLGLVVVFFGTWGDLVESLFKRTLGIKDSGNILPGHGGMLDRFDSSLMAIPAAVVYIYTIEFFA